MEHFLGSFLLLLLVNYTPQISTNVVRLDENSTSAMSEQEPSDSMKSLSNAVIKGRVEEGRYTLYTEAAPWLQAVLACWREGAELAVPRSAADARALGRLLARAAGHVSGARTADALHVGLNDVAVEGDWRTLDGSSVSATGYNDWLTGRLEHNTSRNCGALLADGRYIPQPCETPLAYACEPAPAPPRQADGYVDVGDAGSYSLHEEPATWAEASRRCESEGATLAVPSSAREAGLLAGTLVTAAKDARVKQQGFFVGINDLTSEGDWRTVYGDSLESSGFHSWSPGEPSGGDGENCGALLAEGRYADYPCNASMAYSCEFGGPRRKVDKPSATMGRFTVHMEMLPWLEAAAACRRRNASLAAPRDEEEFQTLRSLGKEYGTLYIGVISNIPNSLTNLRGGRVYSAHESSFRDESSEDDRRGDNRLTDEEEYRYPWMRTSGGEYRRREVSRRGYPRSEFPSSEFSELTLRECSAINHDTNFYYMYSCSLPAGYICESHSST